MATCHERLSTSDTAYSYSTRMYEENVCTNGPKYDWIVSGEEYQELIGEQAIDDSIFNTEAYELAYDGILSSWVIGLGIGLVLAMIAKLKR